MPHYEKFNLKNLSLTPPKVAKAPKVELEKRKTLATLDGFDNLNNKIAESNFIIQIASKYSLDPRIIIDAAKDNPAVIEALADTIANQNANQSTTVAKYSMPKVHAIDGLWDNIKHDPKYTGLAGLISWQRKRIDGKLPDNFTAKGFCMECGEIPIPLELVKHSPLDGCMFCTINWEALYE